MGNHIKEKTKQAICVIAVLILAITVVGCSNNQNALSPLEMKLHEAANLSMELKYDDAVSAYEQVIKEDSQNIEAYIGIAQVYMKKGDYKQALDILTKDMEIFDDNRFSVLKGQAEQKIQEEEQILIEEENEDNRQLVSGFTQDLLKLAKTLYEDEMQVPDQELLSFSIEDFRTNAKKLEEPVIFEEDELYLAVYPRGYVYYGDMQEDSREGYGLWLEIDKSDNEYMVQTAKCKWSGDKPNGMSTVEFILTHDSGSEVLVYHSTTKVNLVDGAFDGEATIIESADGEPHDHVFVMSFKDGNPVEDYVSCQYCDIQIGGNENSAVFGLE